MLPRQNNWVDLLEKAISERAETRFSWGMHDCSMAAVHCINAMVGEDAAEFLRGYKTLRGALSRIAKYKGIGGLAESVAQRHGWPEVKPMFAQRGDCVLIKGDIIDPETRVDEVLGIVDLSGLHIIVADEIGWREFPLTAGIRAWRVG